MSLFAGKGWPQASQVCCGNCCSAETTILDSEDFPIPSSFEVQQGDPLRTLLSAVAIRELTERVFASTPLKSEVRYWDDGVVVELST